MVQLGGMQVIKPFIVDPKFTRSPVINTPSWTVAKRGNQPPNPSGMASMVTVLLEPIRAFGGIRSEITMFLGIDLDF